MNEDREPVSRSGFENWLKTLVVNEVAMHCGEQTHAVQSLVDTGASDSLGCVVLQWVQHEMTAKAIRVPQNSRGYALLISGYAPYQAGALNAVCIQFGNPAVRKCFRLGAWDVPAEYGSKCISVSSPALARESRVESVRKEMNMRIADSQVAPRSLSHDHR